MIEMGKQYRYRHSDSFRRLLCVDRNCSEVSVVSEADNGDLHFHNPHGTCDEIPNFDLIEVHPLVEWWEEVLTLQDRPFCGFPKLGLISREHVDCNCTHIAHFIYEPNSGELRVEVEKI